MSGSPVSSSSGETITNISPVSCVTTPTQKKMNKVSTMPTVLSNDDDDDISYQLIPQPTLDSTLSEKFFETAMQLESTDVPSTRKTKKKRSLFLCCFCPVPNEGFEDSDHGDDYGYNSILDLAGCNMNTSDVDLGVIDDYNDDLISYQNERSYDCASTIYEDEFISCCDTRDFDFDSYYQVSPSLADDPTEPFEEFSSHVRVCNLNVYGRNTTEKRSCDEDDEEMTTDTSLPIATLENEGSGDDESIEAILSTTPSEPHEVEKTQGSKLTFLELTNKYDRSQTDQNYHATVIEAMNAMTQVGIDIAMGSRNESNNFSILWKEEGSTSRLLNKLHSCGDAKWYDNAESLRLLETDTLVWSGMSSGTNGKDMDQLGYGSKIPYFKARGIIPNISPLELAELILDSSRVKLYNKWTNGRDDLHVFQEPINVLNGLYGDGCLKVVQAKTAIPFSSATLKMENFLHGRAMKLHHDDLCQDDNIEIECNDKPNSYVIVSRSIYTEEAVAEDKSGNITQAVPGAKNEMIMGVNIFREVPGHPGKTDLLIVSQANSSAIPSFLAHKAGLMGATDFFRSLRGMKLEDI